MISFVADFIRLQTNSYASNTSPSKKEEELPETTMKTPNDLFDYDPQVYKNRNIGESNQVYIRGRELFLPSKELLNVNKPDIKIIRWRYETDHLRSSDHMDGDYGCTGYFSSLRGYIQNKEVFQSTSVCSCHKRGHPNLEFNVADKYVSAANAQTIDFVNDSLDAFRNKIEPDYNARLKEEQIQEVEEKLQMSRKDLKGLLG